MWAQRGEAGFKQTPAPSSEPKLLRMFPGRRLRDGAGQGGIHPLSSWIVLQEPRMEGKEGQGEEREEEEERW